MQSLWAGRERWTVLDADFALGQRFFSAASQWHLNPLRPRLLHWVAIIPGAIDGAALLGATQRGPGLTPASIRWVTQLATELASQCFGLLPGFHRLNLAQGRITLTLCVGELMEQLRELKCHADRVWLGHAAAPQPWDAWAVKALARCCRRGTRLGFDRTMDSAWPVFAQNGFQLAGGCTTGLTATGHDAAFEAVYEPAWQTQQTRSRWPVPACNPGSCVVLGAGLAGASVAAALARRGWAVTVLDAAPAPASGGSGVPVGIAVPQMSTDDNPRSRLTRHGTRLLLQQAHSHLLQGRDWAASGVMQRQLDSAMALPVHWNVAGQEWATPAPSKGLWLPHGAWLKPVALIAAWLRQPGVCFKGNAEAHTLTRDGELWRVLNDKSDVLASAHRVVLACGLQTARLAASVAALRKPLPTLHCTHGQVSWGTEPQNEATSPGAPPWPAHPVHGWGSWLSGIPLGSSTVPTAPALPAQQPNLGLTLPHPTTAWFAGATFNPSDQPVPNDVDGHRANLQRAQTLLPEHAQALQHRFADPSLKAWHGERCNSHDRLPLVGALVDADQAGEPPSLWVSTAMGSRGLSLAVLCAELLAAQMGGEPWPIEASLARSVDVFRGQ